MIIIISIITAVRRTEKRFSFLDLILFIGTLRCPSEQPVVRQFIGYKVGGGQKDNCQDGFENIYSRRHTELQLLQADFINIGVNLLHSFQVKGILQHVKLVEVIVHDTGHGKNHHDHNGSLDTGRVT